MGQIAERVALNEALFRKVNENILKAADDGRHPDAQFVCECGDRNCEARVTLTVPQYQLCQRRQGRRSWRKAGRLVGHTGG